MPESAAQQRLRPPTHRGPQRSSSGSHPIRPVRASKTSLKAQSLHGGMDRLSRSTLGASTPTPTIKSNDWLGFGDNDSDDDAEEFGQDGPDPHSTNDPKHDAPRPRIQRTLSERRSIANERRPSLVREASSRGQGLAHGVSGNDATSNLPVRSRSDALLQNKRESMKAIYRTSPDDHKIRSTTTSSHGIGNSSSSSGGQASAAVGRPRPARALPPRTMSGLEAGPLLAMAGAATASTPNRTRSLDSTASLTHSTRSTVGSSHRSSYTDTSSDDDHDGHDDEEEDGEDSAPTPTNARSIQDAKWLERRASKMEEIMALAQSVKERFEEERESKESVPNPDTVGYDHNSKNNNDDDGDEDQPMAFRAKKTMLQQIAKGVQMTGNGVRSLGKGTVNAIQDPKLAAKRFGHLSKDVGKATVKTAMDPKKMALGAAKGAKKVTVSRSRSLSELGSTVSGVILIFVRYFS